MPLYRRDDVPKLAAGIAKGTVAPLYLLFGERYLCQEAAAEIVNALLPDEAARSRGLKVVDGEREDPIQTLNLLRTYSLFGGRQVVKVIDSRLLYSKTVAKTLWDKAKKARDGQDDRQAARYLTQMLGLANLTPSEWRSEELAEGPPARWQELFGFARPQELAWVAEVLASAEPGDAAAAQTDDAAELYQTALPDGIPRGNTLILLAEAVDKRKKLYKAMEQHGVVLDLSVEAGATSAARKGQEEVLRSLVARTLAPFGKSIEPQALPLLFDRVGFQPVALVMETEKLALSAGEARIITRADLDAMVGRTREEALYELTEAYADANLGESLRISRRLQEGGMHPLAILAGLRNHLRKLLLARALQELPDPAYSPGLAFPAFQQGYLPRLKEARPLPSLLAGHPYVLYKTFRQAERTTAIRLKEALRELLTAEFRLKGSSVPEGLALDAFFFRTVAKSAA
ncbi:MAG: DNA polymerase III subunit delta [Thermodesulfobacteriota bacterium]